MTQGPGLYISIFLPKLPIHIISYLSVHSGFQRGLVHYISSWLRREGTEGRKEGRERGGKDRRRQGERGREGEEQNNKFQNCRDIFMALTSPPPKIKSYDILIGKQ